MLIIMNASARRDARQAWHAAMYVRHAYHQPNSMPDDPAGAQRREINSQADVVHVEAWMKAVSKRTANGN